MVQQRKFYATNFLQIVVKIGSTRFLHPFGIIDSQLGAAETIANSFLQRLSFTFSRGLRAWRTLGSLQATACKTSRKGEMSDFSFCNRLLYHFATRADYSFGGGLHNNRLARMFRRPEQGHR